MKKFLVYILVLAVVLFVGFMTYYFVRNNESIELTVHAGGAVYMNINDEMSTPIKHTKPHKGTEIKVLSSNPEVAEISGDMKKIVARSGGSTLITVTTTNKEFGPFSFSVYVGTGENEDTPLYINTPDELAQIGVKEGWSLSKFYALVSDLDLSSYNDGQWEPIGSISKPFTGKFDGRLNTIKNLNITSSYEVGGVFAAISSGAKVEAIMLSGVNIEGSFSAVGAIAGINKGIIGLSKVEDVKIINKKEDGTSATGGIVGINTYDSKYPQINMCEVHIKMISGKGNVGGFSGINESGVIINSYAKITEAVSTGTFGGFVGLSRAKEANRTAFERSYIFLENYSGEGSAGGVIGKNETASIMSEGVIYCTLDADVNSATGEGSQFREARKIISAEALTDKNTYINVTELWNFETVWKMDGVARVDFDGMYEPYLGLFGRGESIQTSAALKSALIFMRENPDLTDVYEITKNVVLDLEGIIWEPIGTEEEPFKGSLVTVGDVRAVVKNFKVESGKLGGLFGYISADEVNVISGLTVENVKLSGNEYAGAIAAVNKSASIIDCNVNGVSIKNGKYIGSAFGSNGGSIMNLKLNDTQDFQTSSVTSTGTTTEGIGGVVGINQSSGRLDKILIYDTKVGLTSSAAQLTSVGGVVGINHGTILNSEVLAGSNIEVNSNKTLYVGGIVGFMEGGNLKTSSFQATIEAGTNNSDNFIGGVAGRVDAKIETSYFIGSLTGYNTGGLAGIINGSVSQCFSKGSFSGVMAGGLAYEVSGVLINSFVTGAIEASKVSAGFTVSLPKGGNVSYSYCNLSFGGGGEKYAETETSFRRIDNWILGGKKFGKITNCVVIKTDDTKLYVQPWVDLVLFTMGTSGYIEASIDEGLGKTGDFSKFNKEAGFISGTWAFDINSNPYLLDLPNPYAEIEEEEV